MTHPAKRIEIDPFQAIGDTIDSAEKRLDAVCARRGDAVSPTEYETTRHHDNAHRFFVREPLKDGGYRLHNVAAYPQAGGGYRVEYQPNSSPITRHKIQYDAAGKVTTHRIVKYGSMMTVRGVHGTANGVDVAPVQSEKSYRKVHALARAAIAASSSGEGRGDA